MVSAFQPPGVLDSATALGMVLSSSIFPGKTLNEIWRGFFWLFLFGCFFCVFFFKLIEFLFLSFASIDCFSLHKSHIEQYLALCYSQHYRERIQHKAIPSFIDFSKLSQELPIRNSMSNIWGEWDCTKKGKYLLKIYSPPISMGNPISHCLPKLLRMAILIWMSNNHSRTETE